MIITKHVKFAKNKTDYEWLYKDGTSHRYRYNNFWPESDSNSEANGTTISRHDESKATKGKSTLESETEAESPASEIPDPTRTSQIVGGTKVKEEESQQI